MNCLAGIGIPLEGFFPRSLESQDRDTFLWKLEKRDNDDVEGSSAKTTRN